MSLDVQDTTTLRSPHQYQCISTFDHKLLPSWEPFHKIYRDRHGLLYEWNSRGHRKGIPPRLLSDDEATALCASGGAMDDEEKGAKVVAGPDTLSKPPTGWRTELRKTRWIGADIWDITWWVSILFIVGSIFWCINGVLFFVYFSATQYGPIESATAFLGGTFFLIGAYLGWVESLNPTMDLDFGYEVDALAKKIRQPSRARRAIGHRRHHFGFHHHLPSAAASKSVPSSTPAPSSSISMHDKRSFLLEGHDVDIDRDQQLRLSLQKWKWYGKTRSIAYLANTIQLFGASIFFISVLCGLPGVLPSSGNAGGLQQEGTVEGEWIGLYWATQILGAPCFVIAGIMFCLESQHKWYKPRPLNLAWNIGLWNAVGGFGFFFCGIFGIWRQADISNPELYQVNGTALSTFWGSWAFLLGSYLQLFEGINKKS